MLTTGAQRIKLLKLLELLRQETDEHNPMTTNQICEKLADVGVSGDRRTLSQEIELLNECGYEVMSVRVGKSKAYYIEDRSFSVPELRILIDAVQAASFITEKKTAALIDQIAALGGTHRAALLADNSVKFNTRKHTNETIYYNVNYLEEAIAEGRKVVFRYFDLDENASKVYRREGHHYVVEPVALVFHEDNYYLMTYSAKHEGTANYRVDRMEEVAVIDDRVSEVTIQLRQSIGDYTEQAFKMYGGEPKEVTLEFDERLIGSVYDKFGEDVKMTRVSNTKCAVTTKVQVSPVFWGWVFQFAGKMKIISPENLRLEYKKLIEAAIEEMEF